MKFLHMAAAGLALCIAACTLGEPTAANPPPSAASTGRPLDGVWQRVETVVVDGPYRGVHTADVQPSVFIFVNGYFSVSYVEGYAPRPPLGMDPTDEERGRAFGNFTGYAGTYSLDGPLLTIRRLVSKNPNLMGRSETFTVDWIGNDLWLTMPTHDGPQSRVRLARLADPTARSVRSQ